MARSFELGATGNIIRYVVVTYWAIFWMFNVIDKYVGGKAAFWVGRDRFAQLVKYFSSMGISDPLIPTVFLVIITIIEIGAFVLCVASLVSLYKNNRKGAEVSFFWASVFGLVVFGFFSIGDQMFGDRFELLEHSIFWIIIMVCWVIFSWSGNQENKIKVSLDGAFLKVLSSILILSIIGTFSIINYTNSEFESRVSIVEPVHIGNGIYMFEFPFMAGRISWERSINNFVKTNPELEVTYVYTAPNELKSKKATNLIIYVFTQSNEPSIPSIGLE